MESESDPVDLACRPVSEADDLAVSELAQRCCKENELADWESEVAPAPIQGRLSRYVLLGLLGQGGMGVVYSAYDPKLERKVAIKLFHASIAGASAECRSRILREAQTMARLSHPNIVSVYDVETVGEAIFVVRELIEGSTLRQWLNRRPRPWREVVRVFRLAGRGLAAAHAAGIVHRDFKPDNVLIGSDGRVQVGDFGLTLSKVGEEAGAAQWDAGAPAGSTALTPAGALLGTPAYMSPEQLSGQPAGVASDIFSFCVALHEALFGKRPFPGKTVGELRAAMQRVGTQDAEGAAPVPRWLRRVVQRGLQVEPAARWPTMDLLVAALDRDPTAQRRSGVALLLIILAGLGGGSLAFRASRRPAPLCRGAAHHLDGVWDAERRAAVRRSFIAVGAATGKPWADSVFDKVEAALDRYAADWVAMRTGACAATRITGEQSEELLGLRISCLDRRLAELRALSDLLLTPDADLLDAAPKAARSLSVLNECADAQALLAPVPLPRDDRTRAEVERLRSQLAAAKVLNGAGQYQRGVERTAALVTAAAPLGYSPLDAEALQLWAEYLERSGDFAAAAAAHRRALYAAEQGRDRKRVARAWVELVWVVGHQQGLPEPGLEYARIAESVIKGLPGGDRELEAMLASNRGAILTDIGLRDDSMQENRKALQLRTALFGPDHPAVAVSTVNLGIGYAWRDRPADALPLLERGLSIYGKAFGDHHPQYAHTLINIASTLSDLGRFDQAQARAEQARELIIASLGSEHAMVASIEHVLGILSSRQHRWEESQLHLEHAVALAEKLRGPTHPFVAKYLVSLSTPLLALGHYDEVIVVGKQAAAIARAVTDSRMEARALAATGEALLLSGRTRQAVSMLEYVVRLNEKPDASPTECGEGRFLLAVALWEAGGSHPRAERLAASAVDDLRRGGAVGRERLAEAQRWLAQPTRRRALFAFRR